MQKTRLTIAAAIAITLPLPAFAQTVAQAIALFNFVTGLMITASFIGLVAGFIIYICRIGNVNREEGLQVMKWGVAIIFVLVILLAIAGFIEKFF